MKNKRKIITLIIFFLIISFLISSCKFIYADNINLEKELKNFYSSVLKESGYINSSIEIIEKENQTYDLDFFFKENIGGINLGFYVTPNIVSACEKYKIKYTNYIEGNYIYTILKHNFKTLDDVAIFLSNFQFIRMEGEDKNLYAKFDMTIWNEERNKDELLDKIYNTNTIIFSFKPLRYMETNSDEFKKGRYIWSIPNKQEKDIVAIYQPKKVSKLWIILPILGLISLCFVLTIKNNKNNSCDNMYEY